VREINTEEFFTTQDTRDLNPCEVIVPDMTSQGMIKSQLPLCPIKRRDEWITNSPHKNLLSSLLEKHILLQSSSQALAHEKVLNNTFESFNSLSFTERFFSFYEEVVSSGVWHTDAINQFFSYLPKTKLYEDLHALFCLVNSRRDDFRYPSDALCLLKMVVGEAPLDDRPIYFVGFHRFSYLEKEVIKKISQRRPVTIVHNPPSPIKAKLEIRQFKHYLDECSWVTEKIIQAIESKDAQNIGLILPPHPEYTNEFMNNFNVSHDRDNLLEILNWLESCVVLWQWNQCPDKLVNPKEKFVRLSLTQMLDASLQIKCREIIEKASTVWQIFEKLSHHIAEIITDEPLILELFHELNQIVSLKADFQFLNEAPFWLTFFGHFKKTKKTKKSLSFAIDRSIVHFIDYRCSQFSTCDRHFTPGLNHRVYPPKLPEHPLLDENSRSFLNSSSLGLTFLNFEKQMEDEIIFFHHNIFPQGRQATLTSCLTTPLSEDAPLSLFFNILGIQPEEHVHEETAPKHTNSQCAPNWLTVAKRTPAPIEPKKTVFSASSLESYLKCPFKYYLEKYFGLDDDQESDYLTALDIGSIVHRWLELQMKSKRDSVDMDCFTEFCDKEFPSDIRQAPTYFRYLKQYLFELWSPLIEKELQRLKDEKRRPIHFEYSFRNFEIKNGVTLRGRIDRIDRSPQGLVVVDYKTGKNSLTKKEIKGEGSILQPFIYRKVVEKEFGERVATSEFVFLKEDEPAVKFPEIDLSGVIEECIDRINQNQFEPEPIKTTTCHYCQFKKSCPTGVTR